MVAATVGVARGALPWQPRIEKQSNVRCAKMQLCVMLEKQRREGGPGGMHPEPPSTNREEMES